METSARQRGAPLSFPPFLRNGNGERMSLPYVDETILFFLRPCLEREEGVPLRVPENTSFLKTLSGERIDLPFPSGIPSKISSPSCDQRSSLADVRGRFSPPFS